MHHRVKASTYKALLILLSIQALWNHPALKIIVGFRTAPSAQIVTKTVTVSQLGEPCLCWVFVPWPPIDQAFLVALGRNSLSSIP